MNQDLEITVGRTLKRASQRERLIQAMLEQPSLAKAATSSGVSRATAWRIMQTPEFVAEFRQARRDAMLHTNACCDFTLLAREHWFDLRGYAEMDLYSMNLDSLFCFAAHYGGAREEMLPEPMHIYHIEHGSGWTPEGQARLFERLTARGISFIGNKEVLAMAAQMHRWASLMIFNREDWGLSAFTLKETRARARPAPDI